MKLGRILSVIRDAYCRGNGIEYMHMQETDQKRWVQERFERPAPSSKGQGADPPQAQPGRSFEKFLHTKYVGHKRFGLEGAESLIP